MKRYSMKRRLVASVLLVELFSAVCVCAMAYAYERHARFHSFDIMLRGRADSLLGAVQDAEDAHDNVMLDGTEASLPSTDIFEVWDQDSRILGKSPNWAGLDPASFKSRGAKSTRLFSQGRAYGVIRVNGLRMVDPGDQGGGIARRVVIIYGSPVAPVWRSVWEAVNFYALTSLGILLLTGIMMYWLLSRELAPLAELAGQASQVSATSWAFEPSARARQTVELAPLVSALQGLLKDLERSFSQQQQFVSDAAHELKTGVAVVKSSLQLLNMKTRTAAEYQAGLERCQADCERIEALVAGMLTLARVEGESQLPPQSANRPVADLTEALQHVSHQLAPISELRNVPIRLSLSGRPVAPIELAHAEILFSNLLSNALQHSPAGSSVEVSSSSSPSEITVDIIDHGAGIDAAALPNIFDRFYRSDPSRSRQTGGAGLGLSICQAIVTKSNGSLHISSNLGSGTHVQVRLPAALSRTASPSSETDASLHLAPDTP